MENTSGIKAVGHVVLVLPEEFEEVSDGGIVLSTGTWAERERMAQVEGTVISIGNTAYSDQKEPWCKVGDKVVFAKYSGITRKGKDKKEYRLINDLDIKAVVEE